MSDRWALRPAAPTDTAWLHALVIEALGPYAQRAFGWTDAELARRVAGDVQLDRTTIVVVEGAGAGAFAVEDHDDHVFLDWIALAAARRGRGLGAALVREIQRGAASRGVPLRLNVLRVNPARRLYDRLGFAPIASDPYRWRLEWRPGA